MASAVSICNNALVKVGATRIIALSDDTKQARTLAAIFDVKRDAELAANPWTFAIKRALLPASSTPPAFGWSFAYPLPADYLALVEVGQDWAFYGGDTDTFAIETDANGSLAILTDQAAPLQVRYISRVTNAGLFPPLFVEAFACRLAAEICEDLTQSTSKREAAWAERKQALREARRVNAIEQPPRANPPNSWERAMVQG